MTEAEIYSELTTVFQDVFDDDALIATPDLTADHVPGWDSMAHIRLMLSVERAFGTSFSASQISGLQNVGELVALLKSKTA